MVTFYVSRSKAGRTRTRMNRQGTADNEDKGAGGMSGGARKW